MGSKAAFACCGLISIIIVIWTHNDGYNLTLAQAKAQQEEARANLAIIEME